MVKEFREFIAKGNLVEIAVAFVLGAAFGTVVSTFTSRVVSPLIGMIFDLSGLDNLWTFGPVDPETGIPQGSVGAFLQASINFVIVGLVMFLVVKAYNELQRRQETQEAAPEPEPVPEPEDLVLLREIRDALRGRAG